jgi:hypothetical protein
MNSKKEVIFYENAYYAGPETCEYISDKGILRSDNGLVETSYPVGIKEIKAVENSLNQFWKRLDEIDIWSWNKEYSTSQPVIDGHSWELSLRNKDGKAKHVIGHEMYPHNFQKFIGALNQLFQIKIEIEYEENEQ